jgi:hypothetical protein
LRRPLPAGDGDPGVVATLDLATLTGLVIAEALG